MNSTVLTEIIAFLIGRKYYANIVATRGTTMLFSIKEIAIGKGKPEWGAEPDKESFVIKLDKRITNI